MNKTENKKVVTTQIKRLRELFAPILMLVKNGRRSDGLIATLASAMDAFRKGQLVAVVTEPEFALMSGAIRHLCSQPIAALPGLTASQIHELNETGLRYIGELLSIEDIGTDQPELAEAIKDGLAVLEIRGLTDPYVYGWKPPYWEPSEFDTWPHLKVDMACGHTRTVAELLADVRLRSLSELKKCHTKIVAQYPQLHGGMLLPPSYASFFNRPSFAPPAMVTATDAE